MGNLDEETNFPISSMNSDEKIDFGEKKQHVPAVNLWVKKWQLHTTLQPRWPDGFQTQIYGVAQ